MTKIVKTIDKVTNHENMRRYVHKKLSKGSSGEITADSITPELLENEDIKRRIQNWGLSDEEVEALPQIAIEVNPSGIGWNEDLMYYGNMGGDIINTITLDGITYEVADDHSKIDSLYEVLSEQTNTYDYLKYGSNTFFVFKRIYSTSSIVLITYSNEIELIFYRTDIALSVGKDTI